MATAHLPSLIVQPHTFVPFDHTKTEKFLNEEHEYDISKWLKLENEPLPSLGGSSYPTASDLQCSSSYFSSSSTSSQLPTLQPEFSNNYTPAPIFSMPTSSSTISTQLPPNQMQPSHLNAQYANAPYSYPVFANTQYQTQYQTIHYNANQSQYTSPPNQYPTVQYATNGAFASQFAPSSNTQFNTPTYPTQYATYPTQYIQQTPYSAPAQQYTQNIVPTQVFQQPQFAISSTNGSYQQPAQFQYTMVYPAQLKSQGDEPEDKKRKQVRPFVRRVRQTRPKVVEAKGAVQCKGRNRKKGTQCRNAALMEYIGPRPIYCAEHIELDPKSLYEKCKSSYQKEPGDNKGCKEVVLKEFGVCYKHYGDLVQEIIENRDYEKARRHSDRISDLLSQLEKDAAAAKKKDGDLYQRKNKLIPKFQEMKKLANRALEAVDSCRQKDFSEVLPSELAQLSTPIVLDGLSVHLVDTFTSSEDEELLSSPPSDSSLEEEFESILN